VSGKSALETVRVPSAPWTRRRLMPNGPDGAPTERTTPGPTHAAPGPQEKRMVSLDASPMQALRSTRSGHLTFDSAAEATASPSAIASAIRDPLTGGAVYSPGGSFL